MLIERLNT